MSRCDPPTRIVLAVLGGLVCAGLHAMPAAVIAAIARPRPALLAAAALAALWGGLRVEALDRRTLAPGVFAGVVEVTGRPNGSRAVARVVGAAEDVELSAPGMRLLSGGMYRVSGR